MTKTKLTSKQLEASFTEDAKGPLFRLYVGGVLPTIHVFFSRRRKRRFHAQVLHNQVNTSSPDHRMKHRLRCTFFGSDYLLLNKERVLQSETAHSPEESEAATCWMQFPILNTARAKVSLVPPESRVSEAYLLRAPR